MAKRKKKEEKLVSEVPLAEVNIEDAPKEEELVTLEAKILEVYENAEIGPITISRLLGETGLASKYDSKTGTQILSEAWGKLALQGKVSKTQFLKEK